MNYRIACLALLVAIGAPSSAFALGGLGGAGKPAPKEEDGKLKLCKIAQNQAAELEKFRRATPLHHSAESESTARLTAQFDQALERFFQSVTNFCNGRHLRELNMNDLEQLDPPDELTMRPKVENESGGQCYLFDLEAQRAFRLALAVHRNYQELLRISDELWATAQSIFQQMPVAHPKPPRQAAYVRELPHFQRTLEQLVKSAKEDLEKVRTGRLGAIRRGIETEERAERCKGEVTMRGRLNMERLRRMLR